MWVCTIMLLGAHGITVYTHTRPIALDLLSGERKRQVKTMARALKSFGNRRAMGSVREFCTSSSSPVKEQRQHPTDGKKLTNLFSAINQALHIALETDPRCVCTSPLPLFPSPSLNLCLRFPSLWKFQHVYVYGFSLFLPLYFSHDLRRMVLCY